MSNIIQQIFADNKEIFIASQNPCGAKRKVLDHIVSCRTPELGSAIYRCECGETVLVNHSCRDRHCPICQGTQNAAWAQKQMESALPVKYFHVVFTLPDVINPFAAKHPSQCYDALFKAASSALLKLSANPKYLGATPGFTAVLHTWGQTMQFHPHLHVIITAGGLSGSGIQFVDKSDTRFLFPVKVLSRLFRGLFIRILSDSVKIPYSLRSSLYQKDFFCYLKEPLNRADNVVKYLARYANRVCISDSRVLEYDKLLNTVTFSFKDNRDGGKLKTMTISAIEFMSRFLLHVLPPKFMKIRHYGLLNNKGKFERVKLCRRILLKTGCVMLFVVPHLDFNAFSCPKCGNALSLSGHFSATDLRKVLLRC